MVDLPKDAVTVVFDAPKIMLAVRVVFRREGVELPNLSRIAARSSLLKARIPAVR